MKTEEKAPHCWFCGQLVCDHEQEPLEIKKEEAFTGALGEMKYVIEETLRDVREGCVSREEAMATVRELRALHAEEKMLLNALEIEVRKLSK